MKLLVTGAKGQLGHEVMARLHQLRMQALGVDAEDFDLRDSKAVMAAVTSYHPDVIIHCAAYTAVDRAETEPERCCAVNGLGTLNVVRAAMAVGASLAYISTDYVFDGSGDQPRATDAPIGPLNVYGLSKLQGEMAVRSLMTRYFIIRTSWVYGPQGSNFVKTMLRLSSERASVSVVDDQIGAPTYAPDLAAAVCALIRTNNYGVYHATGSGETSWYGFARAIMAQSGRRCRVLPVSTADYHAPAKRPLNSRLDGSSLALAGIPPLPDWQSGLTRCLAALDAPAGNDMHPIK